MKRIIFLTLLLPLLNGCRDFLDVKPDSKMATIQSREDLWALLDNELVFNSVSLIGEDLSDNYYVLDGTWNSTSNESVRNKYIWSNTENDDIGWSTLYTKVYYANVVLEGADDLKPKLTHDEYKTIIGTALYYRSMFFYELLTIYSLPFKQDSEENQLGVPLRTTADINQHFPRSSTKECIEKIVEDLQLSAEHLPILSTIKTRPSKLAVWSLIARISLDISDYENAFLYSNKVLEIKDDLMDYNQIDESKSTPFEINNEEVIHLTYNYSSFLTQNRGIIDSNLVKSYRNGDRRKECFLTTNRDGQTVFKGSYMQNANTQFTGASTGELYLVFIESSIRLNRMADAEGRLLGFLSNRYLNSSLPIPPTNKIALLEFVLEERRKELLFRNRRWNDIRRLNLEGGNLGLKRMLNGRLYELVPNSVDYAVLIPIEAIQLGDIVQNQR